MSLFGYVRLETFSAYVLRLFVLRQVIVGSP